MDLFEDGRIEANWGRVGATGQFMTNHKGQKGFDSTIRSKEKKGYVRTKTIQENTVSEVPSGNLSEIAKSQIKTSSTEADKLIERLAKANIHRILSQTNISFDSKSGLFQTPLGIVTLEGIGEARNYLDKVFNLKDKSCPSFYKYCGEFLKIIPQKVGRNVKDFCDDKFSTREGIQKQNDILDSLEASFNSIDDQPVEQEEKVPKEVEQLFDAEIELLTDKDELLRLTNHFYNTKKSMHHYGNVKISNIYKVKLESMDLNFDKKPWGNIQEFYHGTGIANCLSILKSGLTVAPPSSAKIAGKMFHNGVYGANCSTKSLGYSLGRWGQGSSSDGAWLFVCDFAMGKTYEPTTRFGAPPSGYDSVSAYSSKTSLYNDEFVVYDNAQVNIKYLIECSA